jgi:hypothetical protein
MVNHRMLVHHSQVCLHICLCVCVCVHFVSLTESSCMSVYRCMPIYCTNCKLSSKPIDDFSTIHAILKARFDCRHELWSAIYANGKVCHRCIFFLERMIFEVTSLSVYVQEIFLHK